MFDFEIMTLLYWTTKNIHVPLNRSYELKIFRIEYRGSTNCVTFHVIVVHFGRLRPFTAGTKNQQRLFLRLLLERTIIGVTI